VVTLASIRVHGQVCAALVSALEVRARHRYRDRRRRPGPASPTLPRTRWPLTARDAGGAPPKWAGARSRKERSVSACSSLVTCREFDMRAEAVGERGERSRVRTCLAACRLFPR
jgi:hypothetical protein